MAQFYTLEEAARVLGMSPEELKAKAQHREVRAFLDGGSWRFRVADVDELARRRGLGSDADLRLSDLELPTTGSGSEADIDLSEFQLGAAGGDLGAPTMEVRRPGASGSDEDILLDDNTLPPNPVTGSSSVIIGMDNAGKLPSDSDVRLVPDNPKGASDSDVRLATPDYKAPSDSDVTLVADETSQHEVLSPGDTAVRQSPLLGSSAEVPAGTSDSDSDFELTPSSVVDALQPDSGSDFELSALEGSDEFEATPLKPSDSDVTAADPGLSGINLSRPSDSGINLGMAAGLGLGNDESIELAPLSASDIKGAPPAPKPQKKSDSGAQAAPKGRPAAAKQPEKDIFDDTDFEVDALSPDGDHEDRTMQLEAASDFELEESDTGSEVFAIDEEDVDQNAATAIGSVPVEDDEEEDDGFHEATSGEMSSSAWDVESDASASAGRAAPAAVLSAAGASPEWGGVWVGMLGATTVCMLLLAFVAMDLVRNLYEYRNDTPASGLVNSLANIVAKK